MRSEGRHKTSGLGAFKFLRLGKPESSLAKRQEENGPLLEEMLDQQLEFSDLDESELLKELKELEDHGSPVGLDELDLLDEELNVFSRLEDQELNVVSEFDDLDLLAELNQLMLEDPAYKKGLQK